MRLGGQRGNLRLQQFSTNIRTLLMTLLIAQMKSPRIGRDQLIKDHAMRLGLKAVQWVFQRGIAAWIVKMSRTRH